MTPDESSIVLTLFTRDPVCGAAKTRLAPVLGKAGAARLAEALVGWTAEVTQRHWPGPVRIAVWPPGAGGGLTARYGLPVIDQSGDDLGARMSNVLQGEGTANAVMGCDVPHVDGAALARAAAALAAGRHVVGPAADGGFYLLGLSRAVPGLFDGIVWSTAGVYARLRDNAALAGAAFDVLPTLRDIDTPADLDAVARIFPPLARFIAGPGCTAHG